jgi:hypothetical protein
MPGSRPRLLFILPEEPASRTAVIDELTRKIARSRWQAHLQPLLELPGDPRFDRRLLRMMIDLPESR